MNVPVRKVVARPIAEHTRAPDHTRNNPSTKLLFETLVDLASRPEVRTVIEIGSTDGRGSTMGLREGLEKNPNFPDVKLFCIEPVKQMYDVLSKTRAKYMKCYRVCSSDPKTFYSDQEIDCFFREDFPHDMFESPAQRQNPVWHMRERDRYTKYFQTQSLPSRGIELIKDRNKIEVFDLAFVDGGTYSGRSDTRAVYGSKYLVLDDVHTLKCLYVFRELEKDPRYRMILHRGLEGGHFGYAAFERVEG